MDGTKNKYVSLTIIEYFLITLAWLISTSTILPSYNVLTVFNLNSFQVKYKKKLLRFVSPLNHVNYNTDHVTYFFLDL